MYKVGYNSKKLGYKTIVDNKWSKPYLAWRNMLRRCYDPKYHIKSPSYKQCEVCDEWKDYQNFAHWYENNYYIVPNENLTLDKDLICKGNNIYSPSTCVLIPERINKLLVNTSNNVNKGQYPVGVCYHKYTKKYVSYLSTFRGRICLGYTDTPEQAHLLYKEAKENYIKEITQQYSDILPSNITNYLINFTID